MQDSSSVRVPPDEGRFFRAPARVELALDSADSAAALLRPVQARRLAGQAREVLGRLSTRRDAEVKEALVHVLDAVSALEREVELLHRRALLGNRGVSLVEHDVRIGGDGLEVVGLQAEGHVGVHMGLRVAGSYQLVSVRAQARDAGTHVELLFDDIDAASRDLVVAFVFEQQRRARRRELDAAFRA